MRETQRKLAHVGENCFMMGGYRARVSGSNNIGKSHAKGRQINVCNLLHFSYKCPRVAKLFSRLQRLFTFNAIFCRGWSVVECFSFRGVFSSGSDGELSGVAPQSGV